MPCSRAFSLPGAPVTVMTKDVPTQFQILHFPAPHLSITGLNYILVYCFLARQDIKYSTFGCHLFSFFHFVVDGYTSVVSMTAILLSMGDFPCYFVILEFRYSQFWDNGLTLLKEGHMIKSCLRFQVENLYFTVLVTSFPLCLFH